MTPTCEIGGNCRGPLDRHHDDYNRPDVTRVLCRRHHRLWHKEHGRAPGWRPNFRHKSDNKQLSTWLPDEAEAVRALADREHRTVSQVLRLAALQYLAANGMAVPRAGEA